jgi:hypothetical protein
MSMATNQSGVFYMGSRSFHPPVLADYRVMPLAFSLDWDNASEQPRLSNLQAACKGQTWNLSPLSGIPSDEPLQFTRQTFPHTTNLADRKWFVVTIIALWVKVGGQAN